MRTDGIARQPLRMLPNRVWRTYTGGALIDRWRGVEGSDTHEPEDWIASTVKAVNAGRPESPVEGLARADIEPDAPLLASLIQADPTAMLGAAHVQAFGDNPALLVKALDAAERLAIQVHPSRQDAQRYFGSPFGKTEAWYVLNVREDLPEPAHVLLGFREHVTPGLWRQLFERQDIQGMQQALHKIPVQPGDIFLVEGGVPHAIGQGCFLMEIQEPTDYTFRTERITPQGMHLSDQACHQGLGFDTMLSMFHYDPLSREETLARWQHKPRLISGDGGHTLHSLLDAGQTPCFALSRLQVHGSHTMKATGAFSIAVVISGEGSVGTEANTLPIAQGESVFLPAAAGDVQWTGQDMTILYCTPPKP